MRQAGLQRLRRMALLQIVQRLLRPFQGARRLLFGLAQRRCLLLQAGDLRLPLRQPLLLETLLLAQRLKRVFALRQLGEALLP